MLHTCDSTGSPVMNTKMFRWQKETQVDYVDPTPSLNSTDPPVFIPPMSPSKISIPGRWQEGDAAWTPNFKVKPSIGFTSTEHPDRPTLLSELAAERAKRRRRVRLLPGPWASFLGPGPPSWGPGPTSWGLRPGLSLLEG